MPRLYINVHQTIWVILASGLVISYIADVKGFRQSVNELLGGGSR